ncbi:MAG: glycosyltransferase [Moraxellaceae bacterium]|nr:glycosyltransferase [Moraxellaceae bacterium]
MSKPKISVILPVYNASLFIEQAMRSVLTQSLHDLELIVINDGSNDDSLAW